MSTENRTPLVLLVIICLLITIYNLYTVATLQEEIRELKELKERTETQPATPMQTSKPASASSSVPSAAPSSAASKPAQKRKPDAVPKAISAKKRIKPTAKVRVENRYVSGKTYLPEGNFTIEGEVTVRVEVDWMGRVTSTMIPSGNIADDDIRYACREAALKTQFSSDPHGDFDSRAFGTITYTFSGQ